MDDDKRTIQIRVDRKIHRLLKLTAFDRDETITEYASKCIKHCLDNEPLPDDLNTNT